MTGALPPSSRCVRFRVAVAAAMTERPVSTLPVTDTILTLGCDASAAPTVGPRPATTLITPAGRISRSLSASNSVVIGVSSDGLITMVLPAAMTGAIFQAAIISG